MNRMPIVAIIGRPNVGKSTLFNRLTQSRDALVEDWPGVTRDRHYGEARWEGHRFSIVDTGGFVADDLDDFAAAIRTHIEAAIDDADLIVLVLDGRSGLTPFDRDMAAMVRQAPGTQRERDLPRAFTRTEKHQDGGASSIGRRIGVVSPVVRPGPKP